MVGLLGAREGQSDWCALEGLCRKSRGGNRGDGYAWGVVFYTRRVRGMVVPSECDDGANQRGWEQERDRLARIGPPSKVSASYGGPR